MRRRPGRRGWAFTLAVAILKPLLLLLTRRTWTGGERIPATGGCLLVVNHTSHSDPLVVGHFVLDHGRVPRYLAKSELFRNRVLSALLRSAGQIPVERRTVHAVGAYDAAVRAVQAGECVVVYPEGTVTKDPQLWPMTGKTGAARIALATGCPVLPVAQWGSHELMPPGAWRPRLSRRTPVTVAVGEPVSLDDLRARARSPEVVAEAHRRIMSALVRMVADLRHEEPPAKPYDPRRRAEPA